MAVNVISEIRKAGIRQYELAWIAKVDNLVIRRLFKAAREGSVFAAVLLLMAKEAFLIECYGCGSQTDLEDFTRAD